MAYLWQRKQDELLQEMIEAGLVAVIIKVAGIGLTEKHLGKTLTEMRSTLVKLVRVLRRIIGAQHDLRGGRTHYTDHISVVKGVNTKP